MYYMHQTIPPKQKAQWGMIRVRRELWAKLKRLSASEGRTIAGQLRVMLDAHLKAKRDMN